MMFELDERDIASSIIAITDTRDAARNQNRAAEFFSPGCDVECVQSIIKVGRAPRDLLGHRNHIECAAGWVYDGRATDSQLRPHKAGGGIDKVGCIIERKDASCGVNKAGLPNGSRAR